MRSRFCSLACVRQAQIGVPKSGLTWQERFWLKVEKGDGCWLWRERSTDHRGYGILQVSGNKQRLAHALAWEMATGAAVPVGGHLLHTCDTPRCVRNDDAGTYRVGDRELPRRGHLALGTATDNQADKVRKGRQAMGERGGRAKLSEAGALSILHSNEPARVLAARLGVSLSTVCRIRSGVLWSHLPRERAAS